MDNGRAAEVCRDLGTDVFEIDTRMSGYAGITAGYLIRGDRPCLVETGTARSAETVIGALEHLGVGAADLATIVVTHIHLDHAGGVGDLSRYFPQATVVVHERGARHLVDPARLVASARRIYGPAMDTLFGELLPTPSERVVSLGDVGTIDLGGGRRLDAFYAPGHASHHVGLVDNVSGDLYTGDAAGIYIPETDDLQPTTPPPDFDLDLALRSMSAMADRAATRLLFSHFGPVTDVSGALERSAEELRVWVSAVRGARADALGLDHAVARVYAMARERYPSLHADPDTSAKFEELSSTRANVNGIWRWLDGLEPGRVSGAPD